MCPERTGGHGLAYIGFQTVVEFPQPLAAGVRMDDPAHRLPGATHLPRHIAHPHPLRHKAEDGG